MSNNTHMINFDEYIRQGDPQKREKGYAWQTVKSISSKLSTIYLIGMARKDIAKFGISGTILP